MSQVTVHHESVSDPFPVPLACGDSKYFTDHLTNQGYAMPGNEINPGGRFLAFGTIYVDIHASANVTRICGQNAGPGCCDAIVYSAMINYHGYDRYQWATLGSWRRKTVGTWGWLGSPFRTTLGTDFNSYWDWSEPSLLTGKICLQSGLGGRPRGQRFPIPS